MQDSDSERLREHPSKRFAAPERKIDLDEHFEQLLSEPRGEISGHRQVTIVHRDALTLILFHFEEGGELPDHQVEGDVAIQVLDGDLEVRTDEENHRLQTGQLLVLASGIKHSVTANAESRMLLTVKLQND